jgi:signal transduction histidine kinase
MDRVGTRPAPLGVRTTGIGLSWTARSWARLRRDVGHALALLAALVALFLGHLAPPPLPVELTEQAGDVVVGSVAVGSAAWIRGVRPGLRVEVWPDGSGFSPLDGPLVDVSNTQVGPGPLPLVVALSIVVAGIAWSRAGLPGGSLLVTGAVAAALTPVYPLLGARDALGLLVVPGLVGLIVADVGERRLQRRFDLAAALALVVLASGFAVLATLPAPGWSTLWTIPGATAVGIVAAAGALAFWNVRRSGARDRAAVAIEMVPIARGSWLRGAAQERDRLAVDLHNEVLPRIDGSIRTLERGTVEPHEAAAELRRIAEGLRGLMHDRQLVVLDAAGLVAALQGHLHELGRHGIFVRLEAGDPESNERPPRHVEQAAYRIAQEAVWNSIRHGDPSEISVRVEDSARRIVIEVDDDGDGFDPGPQPSGHVGLAAMRRHAGAVGAELEVSRREPRGTRVRFDWAG